MHQPDYFNRSFLVYSIDVVTYTSGINYSNKKCLNFYSASIFNTLSNLNHT